MPIRSIKPTTPGQRFMSVSTFEELTTDAPEKSLTEALRKSGGRNNRGRMTIRRRGGGHKRRYRIIDFKRDKYEIEGTVRTIEYDPNRSCRIALVQYVDGEKRYILSPDGIKVGDKVMASQERAPLRPGNTMPLDRFLSEGLASLYLSSRFCRSKGRNSQAGEIVHDAQSQWCFRPNDRQVNTLLLGSFPQGLNICC